MEEIYTCICAAQNHWTIDSNRIKCQICGREYDLSKFNLFTKLSASDFDEIKEKLCVKGPEVENGR